MLGFALLTAGASQTANGASTFDGLPTAALSISVDGTNINDTRFRSGSERLQHQSTVLWTPLKKSQ